MCNLTICTLHICRNQACENRCCGKRRNRNLVAFESGCSLSGSAVFPLADHSHRSRCTVWVFRQRKCKEDNGKRKKVELAVMKLSSVFFLSSQMTGTLTSCPETCQIKQQRKTSSWSDIRTWLRKSVRIHLIQMNCVPNTIEEMLIGSYWLTNS